MLFSSCFFLNLFYIYIFFFYNLNLEIKELQIRLLKNQLHDKKWWPHTKKVVALNLYIGTNVLVYEDGWY